MFVSDQHREAAVVWLKKTYGYIEQMCGAQ